MTNDLWRMGAADLAALIRAHKLSAREAVAAHLARIEAVNPKVNAVTVVLAESALAEADRLDQEMKRRGEPVGPLHGVPFTVKENIDLAGSATTEGIRALEQYLPPADAPHIAQARAAGAIPIGRTNLPDFGLRWHTDNALRGATRNPWDAGRTAGGSSGGEAAALATGMTPLGMGNDLGGSLRIPSAFNGTTALKPTYGRIAARHTTSPTEFPMTFQLMAVEGPMARHVRDLRVAFASITAGAPVDPLWTPAPLAGPALPRPIRVAVVRDPGGLGVDAAVAAGVDRAAAALADAGYQVEDAEPPVMEAFESWRNLLVTDVRQAWPVMSTMVSDDARKFMAVLLEADPVLDLAGYVAAWGTRLGIARAWSVFQATRPLILGPVSTRPPFAVGDDTASAASILAVRDSFRLTVAANCLGLPSVAVPVGVANGLPQGVQVIGPRYREDLCLDAGEAIESRLGIITPIDPR